MLTKEPSHTEELNVLARRLHLYSRSITAKIMNLDNRMADAVIARTPLADNWSWTPYRVYCSNCDLFERFGTEVEAARAWGQHEDEHLEHDLHCRIHRKFLRLDPRDLNYLEV